LISDLVGSTSLASQVGPVRADELRREHFSILREAIAETDGAEEVKNTGDGIMVAFPSAVGATECAVKMQQGFEQRNRDADEQLMIRIGISMGDATHEGDDYFGMPSIEAARLCDKAPGGGILVPELVKMMVGRRSADAFKPAGQLELKGIPEPVEAYEVAWEPLGLEDLPPISLPGRLTGVPPLSYVGREAEVARIDQLWETASGGERQLCLIAGEPGIGKTRLASHAAIARHGEGAAVLYGRCQEELATPFGPWIEALAHYVEHAPEEVLSAHIERYGGELNRLLPGLASRFPEAPPPRETDPETERYLLFNAAAGLLEGAAAERPVVLLMDDLHWADKPTLALLRHVVGSSDGGALLILGTYRDSELSRQHPLSGLLADLRSEPGIERISLQGLGEQDVVTIMETAAGHEMDSLGLKLAQDIATETGGNPFFVTEMLRHLTESGLLKQGKAGRWELQGEFGQLGLPQSVREVVGRRVERLGEPARKALGVAAVIGRDFDVDLLADVVEQGEDELLDLLEESVAASVLVEQADRPGAFSFAHALINHTLYEDLGATRRARLHRRVAEALEVLCGDDPGSRVTELANHWAAATTAVDPSKALLYSRRAGQRALDDLAPDEAMRWFSQALELHSHQAEPDPGTRCDLLIGLGEAQRQIGDRDFRETLLDASAIAQELGDGERLAQAAIANNRGFMSTAGLTDDEVVGALEAALELTDEGDLDRRATLISLLALELIWAGDLERRKRLAAEAEQLARKSGDQRTLAWVLWRRFNPIAVPETLSQRAADMDELRKIAEHLRDPYLRFFAALYSSTQAFETGDRALLDDEQARLNEIAEELGQPVPRWSALWIAAVQAFLAGRMDEAEAHAEAAAQVAADSGQPDALTFYTGQLEMIRWAQDRLDELEETFAQGVEDNPDLSPYRAMLAVIYANTGKADEARTLLDPVAAGDFEEIPREMLWLTTIVQWAEVAADIGHTEAAAKLYPILEPWSDQFPCMSIATWLPVAHYLGLLATTLGRWDDAERHFARSLELEEGLETPVFAACTRLAWGAMLLRRGAAEDAERARALVEGARETARELGIGRIERMAAELTESPAASAW
jgi:tetratricopeptide (TPR) repeat protein